MIITHTQHKPIWNKVMGYWETEQFDPPASARLKNVHWPSDPKSQPVEITWVIDLKNQGVDND